MPHVAHLTTVHVPFDTRIFHKECRTLVAAGYQVSLVASHARREVVDGVEMVPVPTHSRRIARMTRGAWAAYRIARRLKADLYHFHDPELLPVGILLQKTTGAQVIYDAHELYARQLSGRGWLPPLLRGAVPRLVAQVERFSSGRLDAVVCATEHIAAAFPQARTVIIKNYPTLSRVSRSCSETPYLPDNDRVIYTGGWSGHRGIYQIVQALGYVAARDCRLTLLGRCVDPHVEARARTLPGFSRVEYLGMVPYDELYDHMSQAAIGLVCNQPDHDFDKGQPNKLFEYMSAGLPVIASQFPLWQEIVEGSQCGLTVDPTQPKEIARAIDALLADAQLRRQMGENGRSAVLTTYNWEAEGEKLLDLYKELLD